MYFSAWENQIPDSGELCWHSQNSMCLPFHLYQKGSLKKTEHANRKLHFPSSQIRAKPQAGVVSRAVCEAGSIWATQTALRAFGWLFPHGITPMSRGKYWRNRRSMEDASAVLSLCLLPKGNRPCLQHQLRQQNTLSSL